MICIKVPATSANLGAGFDTLGLALNIYNTFYVEKSEELIMENVPAKFSNRKNLFILSYDKTLASKNIKANVYVKFETAIPISRGLGSSSSLIVAGVLAANNLHNLNLSLEEMFEICNSIEGHPDNVAPSLFGGFTSSMLNLGKPFTKKIEVDSKLKFTVMIPNFEVKTSEARAVLPAKINIEDAVFSLSRAISFCFAMQDGNEDVLKISFEDKIHEPYRKNLIPDYDILKKEVIKKGGLCFMISGSGSTCLAISTDKNFSQKLNFENLNSKWRLIDCLLHKGTPEIQEIA